MESTVRSILGAHLQTHMLLGRPLKILEHSTLNEKFSIHQDEVLAENEQPTINYVTIGNGGHKLAMTETGFYYTKSHVHKPEDFALFNHIPFVCRELDNDLDSNTRLKYRLRTIQKGQDGKTYVCYYARVLNLSQSDPVVNLVTVQDGVTSMLAFEPTLDNLSPIPTNLEVVGANTTTGDYLASNSITILELNTDEITELLNACEIMYGDEHYAIISEVGICTGVDRLVNGNFNGEQRKYTDVIACQLYSSSACFHDMPSTRSKLELTINVGAVENLLV